MNSNSIHPSEYCTGNRKRYLEDVVLPSQVEHFPSHTEGNHGQRGNVLAVNPVLQREEVSFSFPVSASRCIITDCTVTQKYWCPAAPSINRKADGLWFILRETVETIISQLTLMKGRGRLTYTELGKKRAST